jgi:flagellar hook-associated protein 2
VGTTGSVLFTGGSSYAKDFQNVVSRAVSIASLPIVQLTSEQTALTGQSQELSTIDDKVAAVEAALAGIGQALTSSFDTSISDDAVLDNTVGEGAVEGNYSLLVSDAGAYSTMMTETWVEAEGAAHAYTLTIGADSFDVSPLDNSAAAVAAAINKGYGDKVHATVVYVDESDYRVSLQSVGLTTDLLDLSDGGSLKFNQTAGRPAQYEVNGSGITVSSDTRTVTIADGVTVSFKSSSAESVDLTVTRSTSALNSALTAFVTAYNAAVGELDTQRGSATGALQGNPIVSQISAELSALVTYTASGAFSGLRDLGIELQLDGTVTQNQFQLIAADLKNPAGITSFVASFAESAEEIMTRLRDPLNGLIATAESDFELRLDEMTERIAAKQAEVDALQVRLLDQMAIADALVASMEQQYGYMASMFQAMRTASDQYQ